MVCFYVMAQLIFPSSSPLPSFYVFFLHSSYPLYHSPPPGLPPSLPHAPHRFLSNTHSTLFFFSFSSSLSYLYFAARLSVMVFVSSDRVVVLFFLHGGGLFTISEPEVVWWGCLDSSMWAKVLVSRDEKQEQLVEKVCSRNAFYMCQCIH